MNSHHFALQILHLREPRGTVSHQFWISVARGNYGLGILCSLHIMPNSQAQNEEGPCGARLYLGPGR